MSNIKFDTVQFNDKRVPASFHDAILKLKDASSKQWISFEADGRYMHDDANRRIYCAVGYLLPVPLRRQLVDSDKGVRELPSVLGIELYELERYLGMSIDDAESIQGHFDHLSREYLQAANAKYARDGKVQAALKENRRIWRQYLDLLLERDNYALT